MAHRFAKKTGFEGKGTQKAIGKNVFQKKSDKLMAKPASAIKEEKRQKSQIIEVNGKKIGTVESISQIIASDAPVKVKAPLVEALQLAAHQGADITQAIEPLADLLVFYGSKKQIGTNAARMCAYAGWALRNAAQYDQDIRSVQPQLLKAISSESIGSNARQAAIEAFIESTKSHADYLSALEALGKACHDKDAWVKEKALETIGYVQKAGINTTAIFSDIIYAFSENGIETGIAKNCLAGMKGQKGYRKALNKALKNLYPSQTSPKDKMNAINSLGFLIHNKINVNLAIPGIIDGLARQEGMVIEKVLDFLRDGYFEKRHLKEIYDQIEMILKKGKEWDAFYKCYGFVLRSVFEGYEKTRAERIIEASLFGKASLTVLWVKRMHFVDSLNTAMERGKDVRFALPWIEKILLDEKSNSSSKEPEENAKKQILEVLEWITSACGQKTKQRIAGIVLSLANSPWFRLQAEKNNEVYIDMIERCTSILDEIRGEKAQAA